MLPRHRPREKVVVKKGGIPGVALVAPALNPACRTGIVLFGECTNGAAQHASPRRTGDEARRPGPPASRPVSGRWTRHKDGARMHSEVGRPPG